MDKTIKMKLDVEIPSELINDEVIRIDNINKIEDVSLNKIELSRYSIAKGTDISSLVGTGRVPSKAKNNYEQFTEALNAIGIEYTVDNFKADDKDVSVINIQTTYTGSKNTVKVVFNYGMYIGIDTAYHPESSEKEEDGDEQ